MNLNYIPFSLLHLNARSINHNLTNLTDCLTTINHTFTIIGITETWLYNRDQNSDYINISGYNFFQESRDDRSGGGIGLFIKSNINFKQRKDIAVFDSQSIESLFIEIMRPNQKNAIIGIIYRPSSADLSLFMDNLNSILSKFTKEQNDCYLVGDFNIDLLKYQQHTSTNDFLDVMYSNSLLPMINRPSRITSHATCIDNIFSICSTQSYQLFNALFLTDISDHLPILSIIFQQSNNQTKCTTEAKRQTNNPN